MAKKKKWKPKKPIKPPKAPKLVKVARPRPSELRKIYKGLITENPSQKVAALLTAMHWFDKKWPYVQFRSASKKMAPQLDLRETFLTCWESASDVIKPETQVGWYKTAISAAEKLMLSVKVKVPPIAKFLAVADVRKEQLETEAARLEEKYAKVLTILDSALQPVMTNGKSVKLKIGNIKERFIVDPELATVVFRKDLARDMYRLLRREGLLPLVVEVLDPLSRISSYELEKNLDGTNTGRKVVNKDVQLTAVFALFDNLVKFGQSEDAPKRLVRAPRAYSPSRAQPATGGFGKREVVEGHYAVGSTGAKLVTLMLDYQWHEKEEMEKVIGAGDSKGIDGRIKSLKRRGEKHQVWKVENKGTQYKLTKLEEGI